MSTSNDNYTIHKVSLKRTRQACGPCSLQTARRKKARCPGEKPVCSLCQRLGQRCTYGAQAIPNRARGQRESTSGQDNDQEGAREVGSMILCSYLGKHAMAHHNPFFRIKGLTPRARVAFSRSNKGWRRSLRCFTTDNQQAQHDSTCITDPIDNSVDEGHALSSDPLPSGITSARGGAFDRGAHPSPFSDLPGSLGNGTSTGKYCAERAWQILSSQYQNGQTGLSFLQGTFLTAHLCFADGNSHRGCASVALGLRVIQSHGFNQGRNLSSLNQLETEARKRITWAFFMLDRTYNASRSYSLCLSDSRFTLQFPSSETGNAVSSGSLHGKITRQGHRVDQGIMACLLRLYSLWGKAAEWVFEPLPTSSLPPWQSGSALAMLESEWMQFETQFADAHRYMNVDFTRRARDEPQSRPYLATWLCVQFLFHSIQCLLHHPFVTMIKLRHMRGNLSATFLQKSFETSLIHSRWIARFVKEMADADLQLCDPFFGYLAAIAATIQLEHTGNKNPKIALLLNNEYRDLVRFMTELSAEWDSMRILVSRINELASRHQNYGSLFYNQDGFSGALSSMATPSNIPRMSSEDEELMWDILDFTSFRSSQPADITQMAPFSEKETAANTNEMSSTSDEELDEDVDDESSGIGMTSQRGSTLGDGVSHLGGETPGSAWPFNSRTGGNTFGSGVPDIPDWMIFGDLMTEHL
ncbi:hypothetical protein N7532_009648 [Penicillium argentinense]|uniref:Zn(2)-C6 fungal-type domain-containing protein n=1 Tax=Penicillium argentinense TaxID=1131581 RepID=A0A9W9EZN4_9EURO|nr:uncharacterized protein N7532_009648 [Penicillium argentinense]KAJ5090964.1 hypothetical protein N7532_009648 [Penicillium argentinense]